MAVRYSAVGRGVGIAAFTARQVDFGVSEVPMSAAEQAAAHGGASGLWRATWLTYAPLP